MEEDNGARLNSGGNPATDIRGAEVFPVQAIATGRTFNALKLLKIIGG